METDPDVPGYRYPDPGERLWHEPWARWVIVLAADPLDRVRVIPMDEVLVRYEGSEQRAVVKLRSLREHPRTA